MRTMLFVDLDNTIIESFFHRAVFEKACGEIAEKTGRPLKQVRCEVKRENLDRQRNPDISVERAMDWDDIVHTVARRLGIELETSVLGLIQSNAGPPYSRVLESADRVLEQLASRDRMIIAATNGLRKYQLPILEALDLKRLFADILTPDSHHALKSERAFYGPWLTMGDLRIMVGDDYEFDILASERFGFKTIWKPNGKSESPEPATDSLKPCIETRPLAFPDEVIHSIRELPMAVLRLEEQARQARNRASVRSDALLSSERSLSSALLS